MPRKSKTSVGFQPPRLDPDERLRAEAVDDVRISPDGKTLELSVIKADGRMVGLSLPLDVVGKAFDQLAEQSAFSLRATTDETAAKVEYPVAGWSVTPRYDRGLVSLACRDTDGTGFIFEMKRDPVTSLPRLELAVDL